MSELSNLLDTFAGRQVLVVGDLMLDDYIFGTASRISPEAPVIVIRQNRTTRVPGGAANVAKNVVALGGGATVIGVVGRDEAGQLLKDALEKLERVTAHTIVDDSRVTTKKTRIVADHSHQVLRIDNESTDEVEGHIADELTSCISRCLRDSDVLILSDYRKGVLSSRIIREAITTAVTLGVPIVANPKPKSANQFGQASVVSLNVSEAMEFLGVAIEAGTSAESAANSLRESIGCESAVITLGEKGMAAATPSSKLSVSAPRVEVYDTAGAGDTVIATLGLCRAKGEINKNCLRLAAEASARVVRHVGVAVLNDQDLAEIRGL